RPLSPTWRTGSFEGRGLADLAARREVMQRQERAAVRLRRRRPVRRRLSGARRQHPSRPAATRPSLGPGDLLAPQTSGGGMRSPGWGPREINDDGARLLARGRRWPVPAAGGTRTPPPRHRTELPFLRAVDGGDGGNTLGEPASSALEPPASQ